MSSDLPESTQEKNIFIICPIKSPDSAPRKRSDHVKKYIIDPIATKMGYSTTRADGISQPGRIDSQIINRLLQDEVVIADITDVNPNVFYELAVRHAVKKAVILIGKKGQEIPFDISAQRIIFYDVSDLDAVEESKIELERQLKSVESDEFIVDSPIRETISLESMEDRDDSSSDIQEILAIIKNQNVTVSKMEELLNYFVRNNYSKRDRDDITSMRNELVSLRNALSQRDGDRENLIESLKDMELRYMKASSELEVAKQRLNEKYSDIA